MITYRKPFNLKADSGEGWGNCQRKSQHLLVGEMGEATIYLQRSDFVYQSKIFKNFFSLSQ
jgi:hypothetical protein